MTDRKKTDYANWIPRKLLIVSGLLVVILVILFLLSFLMTCGTGWIILRILLAAAAVLTLLFFGYMLSEYAAVSAKHLILEEKAIDR